MEQAVIKKILMNAIHCQQINCTLADAIAAAAGIDLDDVIDPVKTADDLLLIGQQLRQCGAIDDDTASAYAMVADSILNHLDAFQVI